MSDPVLPWPTVRVPGFRLPALATASALAALALAPLPAGGAPPRSGQYTGSRHNVVLLVSGRSIDLAAFSFRCGRLSGRTSINAIRIRRRDGVYRFRIRTHGTVSFTDRTPDENAAIRFRGRFSSSGRSVRGVFRVVSRHCGTGYRRWSARR